MSDSYSKSPRTSLEESKSNFTFMRYGTSVPSPIYPPSTRRLPKSQTESWKYTCPSLKTETLHSETRKDFLYTKQLHHEVRSTRTVISSKESLSSFGDSSDEGSLVEEGWRIRSCRIKESSTKDGDDLDIDEQEVFDFSSVSTSSGGNRVVSYRRNRSFENKLNDRDESSERDDDVEKRQFIPPHLLVQRDTQSLFERPCSKRMINWT